MKKSNKGYTLVEFIVVMAIVAILGAVSLGAMSTAYNARTKKATDVLYNAILECKSRNLSGQECYMNIGYKSADKSYYYEIKKASDDSLIDTGTIGNSNLKIRFYKKNNINCYVSSYVFKISFDKKTGHFYGSYIQSGTTKEATGSVTVYVYGVGKTRSFLIDYHTGYLRNVTVS